MIYYKQVAPPGLKEADLWVKTKVAERDSKPEYALEIPFGDRDVLKSGSTESFLE